MNTATKIETLELVEQEPAQQHALTTLPENSPAGMMLAAMSRGASLEQVEKMMDLQERWEAGEARKAYNTAFAAFKSEAIRVIKNRQVTAGPLQGKSYAELFSVVDAVTPALSKHGLSSAWKLSKDEKDWLEVTCTIRHAAGHSESVSMGGPPDIGGAKNAIQARASTISYLERYTLKAICGVAESGEDDDGQGGASGKEGEENPLIQKGRDAAMDGMESLTKWWGGLTAGQRKDLNKDFPGLRGAAQLNDARGQK